MEKHITVVAALHVGFGIFGLMLGIFLFVLFTGLAVAAGDEHAFFVLSTIGTALGALFFIISVPGLIGGIGLFARKAWARIVILVVSAIDLLNFPVGTALGIYSLWVLVQPETTARFSGQPLPAPAAPPPADG